MDRGSELQQMIQALLNYEMVSSSKKTNSTVVPNSGGFPSSIIRENVVLLAEPELILLWMVVPCPGKWVFLKE